MRLLILILAMLLCCAGWWMGIHSGLAVSVLVAAALILMRYAARRFGARSGLASMPTWQFILVPILGLPVGVGLSLIAVVLGPGL